MAGVDSVDNDQSKLTASRKVKDVTGKENMKSHAEVIEKESDKKEVLSNGNHEAQETNTNGQSLNNNDDVKNSDKPAEEEKVSPKPEQDLVLIQDTGFTVSIHSPGAEPFDLPVSSMELVQEIYQVLVDREDSCHRTCFTLQLDGVTMDNFAELKTIEGLSEGSKIKVVEEPYTIREARIHVRHVRDLLKSVDQSDAYNGVDCNSLSFLNVITGENSDPKRKKMEANDCNPPDYILPGSKERPLLPLHPIGKENKIPKCLNTLTYSGWNPPPGNRRMHGDLLYLYAVTLEEKRFHITASTKGFYINQSTQDEFNPNAATPQNHLSHSLIDLLSQISPAFKRNFSTLLKKRSAKHPFERVATPYQVFSWMAPQSEHSVDYIRAEDAFSSRLGYEEHIPGQTREWNEELQTTRELSRKNLPERLIRERAIFKVHSDFVVGATRGAMAVIDGNIMAINPGDDSKMQMFLWNNIFFSLGFDVKDHYKEFGGDAAAYVAPSNDLQGVKAYASVDAEGLYTLGTVVVDYRGYRVTAQSIIPGILEREQEQSVVYGSVDFGKTVISNDKYKELLTKSSTNLKIRPHKVLNEKGEVVELFSSMECKGIVGNDGRHYVLDLLRTFPPDVNYLDTVPLEDYSQEVREMGYPRAHPHRLASLRHELVDAFVENRYVAFVKHAAYHFQQLRIKKLQEAEQTKKLENQEEKDKQLTNGDSYDKNELEDEEAKKIVEALTDTNSGMFEKNTKEIVKKASSEVGSLSDVEFNISFNPDVYQHHVNHYEPQSETMKKEKTLVRDAAEFLLTHQIPNFIRDCLEHSSSPIDGYTLTEALHHNGINMRYLGKITEIISKYPQLSYLHSICIAELICRAGKHLLKAYMQGVEMMSISSAITHFLNCFLGAYPLPQAHVPTDELHRSKKKSKRRQKGLLSLGGDNHEWATETPKTLWKKLCNEIKNYFTYTILGDSIESAMEKYEVQKISVFRSFCKKVGIQVMLREYQLDNRNKQAFVEDDIINVFPIVKHIHPKASDAYHVFTTGQQKIQQGLLREGFELISEAMNLLNNVYGAMHPEIAACARLLARLNYIMGDYSEALAYQQRAVLMSERVQGIDHPNTITEYAHMALYSFANGQISNALRLIYRARYLALLCHGENHPEIALFDSNIGLILQAAGEYELSLKFLLKALELNAKFFGNKGLKVAMSYHLVARAYSCKGDFRTALGNEKEAYTIYKQLLGESHERTQESSECLKHLTQQAVKFQKTMNEIYKGEKTVNIPPLQIQTPSLSNVLETLNLINGIVFVHISQEDIERFKEEMVRRQQSSAKANNEEPESKQEEAGDPSSPTDSHSTTPSEPSSPESQSNSVSPSPLPNGAMEEANR